MDTGKTIAALLTGLVAGAALGILFAPDKGSETRKRLSGSAKDIADQSKDIMFNWKDKLSREQQHAGNGHAKTKGKHA